MPTRNPNVVLSPEEIASALRDRPHLTAQVVTIRDDKTLNPQRKLERITALIRGDAAPVQQGAAHWAANPCSHVGAPGPSVRGHRGVPE